MAAREQEHQEADAGDDDIAENAFDDESSDRSQQLAVYLAASFTEALAAAFAVSRTWQHTEDWEEPLQTWLEECDSEVADLIRHSPKARESLLNGIFAMYSLPFIVGTSGNTARFAVGDRVLGLLSIDRDWHEAKVEAILTDEGDTGDLTYMLRFIEYGNPQRTAEADVVMDSDWLAANENNDACTICRRKNLQLTFHHLVPKETHAHVLKRSSKALLPQIEDLYVKRPDRFRAKSRKDWLEVHGIEVCRKCHSQIHRVESNMSLAISFNTLERILEHPGIVRWRAWASRQKQT